MLRLVNNKKGDSLIVSYVLLISITLAIAGLAYGWLRFQSDISEPESCPEGVSIYISEYSSDNPLKNFNLTLTNRGRFNIKGFYIRINNDTNFESGVYNLGKFEIPLKPEEEIKISFNETNNFVNISRYNKICFIEIQPFVNNSRNEIINCPQISTKKIDC